MANNILKNTRWLQKKSIPVFTISNASLIILPLQMKNIPFPQYIIIQTFFPAKETDKCRKKINILSLFLSFVFKPAVSHRDILSLCGERSLSIPITEFNHIGTILQICLQLCSTALMFPYKADLGSFTAYF